MAYPLPGETPFTIDGTGRVIRPGDKVVVHSRRGFFASSGPAVVVAIDDMDVVEVRFPFDEDALRHPTEICRADDHERTPEGDPLWSWL